MSFLNQLAERFGFIRDLVKLAEEVSLPGFHGIPIYDVLSFFFEEIQEDSINVRAGSISWNIFLAFFPAIIFIFTLIPYIPIPNLTEEIKTLFSDLLPEYTFQTVWNTIEDIINIPRTGLLSVGFLAALFFASNGTISMIHAFDKKGDTFTKRNFLQNRWIAIQLTFFLFFLLLVTIVMLIGSQLMVNYFSEILHFRSGLSYFLLKFFEYVIIFFAFFNTIALIYNLAPNVKLDWHYFSVGATFATLICIISTSTFGWYLNNFSSYNTFYGSIGTVMALMVLIYLNATVLLIGFEINTSIAVNKHLKSKSK